uniref:Haloacid dehalogenase-like hydrolase n=1 Tax=Globisporangium ultimum (strain ATCC 200006 / CBS 805.95 / DAOM BR144) TaxID=431595 RepID=K3W677_GLOUD
MEVRGVTFDLDDTLWCGKRVIVKANSHFHAYLRQRLPALSAAFPPAAFDQLLARFMRELPDKAHDYTFLRKHTLRHCVHEIGPRELQLEEELELEVLLEEAFQAFLIPRSQPEFFEGVEQLLHQLDLHLRSRAIHDSLVQAVAEGDRKPTVAVLGVITNGNCMFEQLPEYFRACMNFMISAEGVGKAKPALEIFDAAVAQFPTSYDKAHIVHVGDHYEYDVVGAKKAGLRTIWVNAKWPKPDVLRRQDLDEDDAELYDAADAIVKDVNAVLDVVTLWNKEAAAEQQQPQRDDSASLVH